MKYIQDLRNRFAKEEVYSFDNYFKDKELKRELSVLDKTIGHIKGNKKLYKILITTLAVITFNTNYCFASIDSKGHMIHNKIINISYWIVLIKGSVEIIQNLLAGDLQGAKRAFFTYIFIYGSLLALPWGLDIMKDMFAK